MSDARVQRPEGELLNIVGALGPLAWRKYRPRWVGAWDGHQFVDVPGGFPWVVFRFVDEDAQVMRRLHEAVASYEGLERWLLLAHVRDPLPGTNWTVCAERSALLERQAAEQEMELWAYLEQLQPGYSQRIFEDFSRLTEHVRQCLSLP